MPDLRAALTTCPIVAILRGVKPDEIDAIGDALVEAGVTVIEVPLNSPQPFRSIEAIVADLGVLVDSHQRPPSQGSKGWVTPCMVMFLDE